MLFIPIPGENDYAIEQSHPILRETPPSSRYKHT